jgi:hypothetical protein
LMDCADLFRKESVIATKNIYIAADISIGQKLGMA